MAMAAKQGQERDVQSWTIAGGDVVRLRVITYRDRPFIDLRRWYKDDLGELRPTSKGIRLHAEMIGQLRAALVEAEDLLEEDL